MTKNLNQSQYEKKMENQLEHFVIKREHFYKNQKTIFTDIKAVLKKTLEWSKDCIENKKKFDDFEFGPN